MHALLAWSILSLGAVFLALTFSIVLNKAWREGRQRLRAIRRRTLEPLVLAYAHGESRSLLALLGGGLRRRDRPVLEELLLDYAQRVRGVEREALTRALDELGYVRGYRAGLTRRRWWQRAQAAERLGVARATSAAGALGRALGDEVPEVRLRAAKALGELGDAAALGELIRALDEPNRWSTIRIADVLTGVGGNVVDELMDAFPTLGRAGRLAALDVLGRVRPPQAAVWLAERLGDPDPDVRARACHALGGLGDPNRTAELLRALEDPEWPVRAMAAKALGRIGHPPAIPALSRSVADAAWWVRANAAGALGAMGEPGIAALEQLLDSTDRFARDQAVLRLQEAGIVDALVTQLGSANGQAERARTVVRGLVAAGRTGRLRALADDHPDPAVRQELAGLLPADEPAPNEASR